VRRCGGSGSRPASEVETLAPAVLMSIRNANTGVMSSHGFRSRSGLQQLELYPQLRDLLAQRRRCGRTGLRLAHRGFNGIERSAPATAASGSHPLATAVATSTPLTVPLTTTAPNSTWTLSVLHRHVLLLVDSRPVCRLPARWPRLGAVRPRDRLITHAPWTEQGGKAPRQRLARRRWTKYRLVPDCFTLRFRNQIEHICAFQSAPTEDCPRPLRRAVADPELAAHAASDRLRVHSSVSRNPSCGFVACGHRCGQRRSVSRHGPSAATVSGR
jgi:hypothetical protein